MFRKVKVKKNKLSLIILAIFIIALSFISVSNFALAQTASSNLATFGASAGLGNTSLPVLLGNIVRVLLSLLGVAAVLIMLYAGFIWMTAAGDPAKVEKAKKIMVGGVIGLVIIVSSFAIASFVMNAVGLGGDGQGQPCTSGDYKISSDGCSQNSCVNKVWTGWTSTGNPGCDGSIDPLQSTYITKFSDSDLGWNISVKWNDSRVIGVPQSTSTLRVGGYAKNKGGNILGMSLMASSTISPGFNFFGNFENVSTTIPIVNDAYYVWNTAIEATGTIFSFKVKTSLSATKDIYSWRDITTIIRARHCFDKIKNFGETKVDCGGECGACPGESCNNNLSESICSPNNTKCSNGLCEDISCNCMLPPHIDSISPSNKVASVLNITGNMMLAAESPTVARFGAPDNFIKILSGVNVVPANYLVYGVDVPATSTYKLSLRTSAIGDLNLSDLAVTNPPNVGEQTCFRGNKVYHDIKVYVDSTSTPALATISAEAVNQSSSTVTEVEVKLPAGNHGLIFEWDNDCGFATGGSSVWNSRLIIYNLKVDYLSGTVTLSNGAVGNYITIWGSGFGTSSDAGSVNFINKIDQESTVASLPASPCQSVWTDNQIIVEVPDLIGAVNNIKDSDVANYSISNYLVTVNNGVMYSDNQVDFQLNKVDRPGICSVNPAYGVSPATTIISGNKFLKASYTPNVVWDFGAFVGAKWENGKRIGGAWKDISVTSSQAFEWETTTVTDTIPSSGVSGNMAKIRIYNGLEYSNYFLFTLSDGSEGSFCGGTDEGVCVTGDGACSASLGLVCNHSSCTCQKGEANKVCTPGALNTTTTCSSVGICSYVSICNSDGSDWECVPKSDDPGCSPNIFIAQATQSLYAWGFKVTAWGGDGQSCGLDVWGVCDPRGCEKNTTCNTNGSLSQWVELYNSSSSKVSTNGWKLAIFDNMPSGLKAYYPLYADAKDLTGTYNAFASAKLIFYSDLTYLNLNSSAYFNGGYNIPVSKNPSLDSSKFNTYVELPTSSLSTLNQSQEGTFSAWIKPENFYRGRHIVYFGQSGTNSGNGFGGGNEMHLSLNSRRAVFVISKQNSSSTIIATSAKDLTPNTWYHIVATYKNNGGKIKLYVFNLSGQLVDQVESINSLTSDNIPVLDRGLIGRSIFPLDETENRVFKGNISDVALFDRELTESEVRNISKPSQYSLPGVDMGGKGFYSLETSNLTSLYKSSSFKLSYSSSTIFILDNNNVQKVSLVYGPNVSGSLVYRALAPYSFGLAKDGVNTGLNTDFSHFITSTKSAYNYPGAIASGNGVTINELFLGARPCTCVPTPACSKEGEERSRTVNNCPEKQFCRDGHWTDWQVVSNACYSTAPQATQAVFTWAFMMHASNGNDWPFVIEDCNRSLSCNPKDRLPSPTPWYLPSSTPSADEGWSISSRPDLAGKILNSSACENAIISARFSQQMLESSFVANDSVRVYKQEDSPIWGSPNIKKSSDLYFPPSSTNHLLGSYGMFRYSNKIMLTSGIENTLPKNYVSTTVVVDSDGLYRLSLKTSNTATPSCENGDVSACAVAHAPDAGHKGVNGCFKEDGKVYHDIQIYLDGEATPVKTISALAHKPEDATYTYSGAFNLTAGTHDIVLKWINDCNYNNIVDAGGVRWDSNLVIYNLGVEKSSGMSTSWTKVTEITPSLQSDKKQLVIGMGKMAPSTVYKVILTDSIRSDAGWPLKKENAKYNPLVTSRGCSIDGITTTAYCWNFKTRDISDPDFRCKEGCPTCTPDPTKGGYYGAENTNNANLDSKDNVCLMLNPWEYQWAWSTTSPAGYREDIGNKDLYTWNAVLGRLEFGADEFKFVDPRQTSTARGETIYDTATTTINATLVDSKKSSVCVVQNNFHDPYVMNESNCDASSTPSPSPRPTAQNVCLNAAVLGRFNIDMYDDSVASGLYGENHSNLIIQECGSATSTATSSDMASCTTVDDAWNFEIFPYTHSELTMDDMINGDLTSTNTAEGFLAYPKGGAKLLKNTWYRVIVKGTDNGVRSASNTPNGTELPQGVLLQNNNNFPENSSLPPHYYWVFKTGNGECKIDYVNVSPFHYFMPSVGLNQQYFAIPYSCNKDNAGVSTGVVLNPESFTWNWRSLIKLTDDVLESDSSGGTGISIANICKEDSTLIDCLYNAINPFGPISHIVKVWGKKAGPIVNIKARAVDTHADGKSWNSPFPDGDASSSAQLKIGSGNNFSINSKTPGDTICSNPDITLSFSEEASSASLSLNSGGYINLYKCGDPVSDPNCMQDQININGFYPFGLGTVGANPKFSSLMIAKTSGLLSGKYRVAIYGGSGAGNPFVGGIQSWSGDGLNNLNFKPFNNISGEACEPGVYPWNTKSGVCNPDNCTLEGDLCPTRFKECDVASIGDQYCNPTCHNLGNNNIASCSNGKVEAGEDCDIGTSNGATSSPCNISCLWKGSNKLAYGSLCGNGKIEKGEQCDDGNIDSGDGCSDKCLYENDYASNCSTETATPTTTFNGVTVNKVCLKTDPGCTEYCLHTQTSVDVPVCGNKVIEKGEQCDDGNIISGDGCKGTEGGAKGCLWEGNSSSTQATNNNNCNSAKGNCCGNDVIENGQNNYYSWTFNVANNPTTCEQVPITLNPCPNGIWQASLDKSISSSTIIIQKGFKDVTENPNSDSCVITTDFSSYSFFQKIIRKVKLVIRDFFGVKLAIADNYWCQIYSDQFNFDTLHLIDKGNYEATTTIDGANTRVLAYPDSGDSRIIRYIRSADWNIGTPYRMRVLYSRDSISGMVETSTKVINIYSSSEENDYNSTSSNCSIKTVEVNAWPKGEKKNFDAFFCKGENCGLDTPVDLYDDDVSAEWNQRYSITSTLGFLSGNQHLYRAWAYSNSNFLVKANFNNFSMVSVPYNVGTERTSYNSSTYYNGGNLITSGQYVGRTNLYITANNSNTDTINERASTTVDIRTMFCKNPWPSTQNPRFLDSNSNCATVGGCVNTNFETWYCRDSGLEDVCVGGSNSGKTCKTSADCAGGSCQLYTSDDLPSIGSYSAFTGKWNAAITGLGTSTCANLADGFIPKIGYYDNHDLINPRTYLWNDKGVVYMSSSTGWVMLSRGDLAQKGLPANFGPTVGYYNAEEKKVQLWDYDGNLYEYDGSKWSKNTTLSAGPATGLLKGFRPIGGYFYKAGQFSLWNAAGRYAFYDGNQWGSGLFDWEIGGKQIIPVVAYSATLDTRDAQMWDNKGNLFNNVSDWVATTRPLGLPTDFKPDVGYYNGSSIVLWDGQKSYSSPDGTTYTINNQFEKTCDRKVKEFLFVSANNDPVQTLSAGAATYDLGKGGILYKESLNAVVQLTKWDSKDTSYLGSPVNFYINAPYPGQYNLTLETSNGRVNPSTLPDDPKLDNCKIGNNLYHNIEIYIDGIAPENKIDTIRPLATSPTDTHQITRTASFNLTSGPHQVILHWTNDCNVKDELNPVNSIDSNLAIYNLNLYSYNSDAIGIRVMTNNNHYSPYYWYTNTFNGGQEIKGLNIDGYAGVGEGRTVYANATDMNTSTPPSGPNNIFGDIFLMSYSQGADGGTTNIYNQMVNNWRFNAGSAGVGGLDDSFGLCSNSIQYGCVGNIDCGVKYATTPFEQNLGTCISLDKTSVCSFGFKPPCLNDSDCQKMGAGYCNSFKSKLVRDTKRLSDVQDINFLLNNYYSQKRCSNDQYRLCIDSQDCYGGGTCSNYYPSLDAGTYIAGRTFSAWPSWQDNLSQLLGYGLPVDPLNIFLGCVFPYDSTTCWSTENKIMSNTIESSSSVYTYRATGNSINGTGYELFVHGEYDATGNKWKPDWESVNLMRYNPFVGYTPGSFWRSSGQCGNGVCGDGLQEDESYSGTNYATNHGPIVGGVSEDCSTCWTDCGCRNSLSCRQREVNSPLYSCKVYNTCGDKVLGGNEQCDGTELCDNTCQCTNYATPNSSGDCGCIKGYTQSGDSCVCANGFSCSGSTTICDGPRYIAGANDTCVCNTAEHFSCINSNMCAVGYTYNSATKKCDCDTSGGFDCSGPTVTCQAPRWVPGDGGTCDCNFDGHFSCFNSNICAVGYTYNLTSKTCGCDTAHGYETNPDGTCSCNGPKYAPSSDGSCICNTTNFYDCTNPDPEVLTCDSTHAYTPSGESGNCDTPCIGASCCRQEGCNGCIDSNHELKNGTCDNCKPGHTGADCSTICSSGDLCGCSSGYAWNGLDCVLFSSFCAPNSHCTNCGQVCNASADCCSNTACSWIASGVDDDGSGRTCISNGVGGFRQLNKPRDGICDDGENINNSPDCAIKKNDFITLRFIGSSSAGGTNPFVSVNMWCSGQIIPPCLAKNDTLNANRSSASNWEQFAIEFNANESDMFIRDGGTIGVISDGDVIKLRSLKNNSNRIIKYANSWLNANDDGDEFAMMICKADSAGCNSEEDIKAGDAVSFQSNDGEYIGSDNADHRTLTKMGGSKYTFYILNAVGDKITLNNINLSKRRVAGAFEEASLSTSTKTTKVISSGGNLLNTFFVQFLNAFNI